MALYHFSVRHVSRGKGQMVVASAAYISGQRIYDGYYNKIHDYTSKSGVVFTEILTPEYVPECLTDRETLWNEVDHVERNNKAQLAYSFDIALQNELTLEENIRLAKEFCQEHFGAGKGTVVMGRYGINIDVEMGQETFEYLIADPYDTQRDVPEGFVTRTIPAFDWAVFPCRGAMPDALQDVNTKIYTEWLPALKEYEFAAGYCVEYYDDPSEYEKGTLDENYYCEIWIPVKKKG